MNLPLLAVRNVMRNRFRTTLTICGVAVAVLCFVLLRTVVYSWTVAVDQAASDRIGTRHKITFIMPLPRRYIDEIRSVPGVTAATWMNWFGGKDPKNERDFFATIAVDSRSFLTVYDEIVVPPEDLERWYQDRKGALVGDALAKKKGWKVGDRITLVGTIFPGEWEFHISGIYTATRKSVDRSTLWFHWDYLNESLPERLRDTLGWVVSRVSDPARTAEISKAIDARFEDRDVQTLSMSERALNLSFMGMLSAVLTAVDIVSVVILVIMMLILGNTIAMGVRERTAEYGVLRAIGFWPRHLAAFVLGEGMITGLLGGALGLLLSYPIVEQGLGRWVEENMGALFPYFRVPWPTAALALTLALVLGVVASLIPAWRAARLDVITALRRMD
ncbi:MAG: ABC transporter permease [Myxococcales bacterium]|nr:ABC transporter permease [Myxococcota bacterium]MDW8282081.1 ABC transporter permease [Myxococcales bacterium]